MTAVAHQVTPFLTSYEVMARYHISYTTLWRRIKDGSLPQPRMPGAATGESLAGRRVDHSGWLTCADLPRPGKP